MQVFGKEGQGEVGKHFCFCGRCEDELYAVPIVITLENREVGRMPPQWDLTAAGVGETLDGLLGKNTHPDVRQNAASYTAIMQNAGFGSLDTAEVR